MIDEINEARQGSPKSISLGRLGLKNEPGKVRVFAMVDYWTQVAVGPLHDKLFELLRTIRQDGTFIQEKPLKALVENMSKLGLKRAYSFDLSAATDRLPLSIQKLLLNALFSDVGLGDAWGVLLADRDFRVPEYKGKTESSDIPKSVRYAVGQPMGALSSWAMLALTHHMIVQAAARGAGKEGWFELYAVLGDDVVIGDPKVAKMYLLLMKALQVDVSLAKSLVSDNLSMEFAKRFIYKGTDISPLSLKEFDVALRSLPALLSFIRRVATLVPVTYADVLRACGFGYRVLGRITSPLEQISTRSRWLLTALSIPGMPLGKSNWVE